MYSFIKHIVLSLLCCTLFVQCDSDSLLTSRKGRRLLTQADEYLANYQDDAAWNNAVKVEKFARKHNDDMLLCKALLVKGKVCDYADVSADSNRNDEALVYLQESAFLADKYDMLQERVASRFLISEVYVNLNRWKNDSIDKPYYDLAGKWLDEGEHIASDAKDTDLKRKAEQYRIRYLRQGGRYDEAIALCNSIINTSDSNNYLAIQQMYDQLTALYTLVGNSESSADAHAQYVIYTQKQISQAEEKGTKEGSRISRDYLMWIIGAALLLVIGAAVAIWKIQPQKTIAKKKAQRQMIKTGFSISVLSAREREILCLMSEGKKTADIAHACNISTRTVSNHKQNIYSKLGVNSSSELFEILSQQPSILKD